MELKIEYIPVSALKPYEKNTRKHQDLDVANIAKSIEKYGFNDAIGIWGDNIIVEGHGRLLAAKKLGLTEVPCVRLDHLTDEERREYAIAHNATAELSEWEVDLLGEELAELDLSEFDFDFGLPQEVDSVEDVYTSAVNVPQYEPTGEAVAVDSVYDDEKYKNILARIDGSALPEAEKQFLRVAACRHIVFDYKRIADYYATASKEMQELMEDSALVIIDYDDAIAKGYVKINDLAAEMLEDAE